MSRQRNIYPTDQITHLWAHQTQDSARNKLGNLYFSGKTIYSYGNHFDIATITEHEGKKCILFTTGSHSVTTAKHIGLVRRAVSHELVFNVPFTGDRGIPRHASNVKDYRDRVLDLAQQAKRARSRKAGLAQCAINLAKEANRYIEFFGLDEPTISANCDELIEQAAAAQKLADEKAERQRKELAVKYAPCVLYWKTHGSEGADIDGSYYFPQSQLPCYLRTVLSHPINEPNGKAIQTSWGAEIPYEHGRKAFEFVKRCRDRGEGFQTNGKTIHVGNFKIESIDKEGNLSAGCHYITWSEIEDLANREGWEKGVVLPEDEAIPGEHDVVIEAINEASLNQ